MRITLIRHGETAWNQEGRCQGFSDISLNKRGLQQAEKLAASFKDEKVNAIYCSPLKRARQTAEMIAKFQQIPIFLEDGLKELNQGILEGLSFAELEKSHQALLKEWMINPCDLQLPQGECLRKVQERAWNCIQGIIMKHQDEDNLVVVSHNLTIMTILCRVLNLDLKYFHRLKKDVGAKTIVEFTETHPILIRLNDISHLDEKNIAVGGDK